MAGIRESVDARRPTGSERDDVVANQVVSLPFPTVLRG
jgi:hypothetical protein